MVVDGLDSAEAAKAVKLQKRSLRTMLNQPHVIAFRKQVFKTHVDGLGFRAVNTLVHLMETSNSDKTRIECAERIARLAGINIEKTEENQPNGGGQGNTVFVFQGNQSDVQPDQRGIVTIDAKQAS